VKQSDLCDYLLGLLQSVFLNIKIYHYLIMGLL